MRTDAQKRADKKYYAKKRLDKKWMKERAALTKEYITNNKEKQKLARKKSYDKNFKLYNKRRYENYEDPSIKERIKKCLTKQKEQLTDTYIKRIDRNKNLDKQEIEIRKNEILIHRINKQIKLKQNEFQNSRPA